ncbi:hypothetical protein E8E14_005260 [Neopestalotiopsis sp. 37M]|nr:hypothetical protein E8E14_005260 [Neopestalotiopsis sp. 37M]
MAYPIFGKARSGPRPAEEEPESCILTRFSARSVLCDPGDDDIEFNVSNDGQVLGMMSNDAGIHNWFWEAGFLGISHQSVPEANFGIRRINPTSIDFDMIKDCISICRNTHTECPLVKGPPIPELRVIDCACAVPEVIETPMGWFPPVIMDAIIATVEMGFRYLWVDRHCIDQNDPAHRGRQIELMSPYYMRKRTELTPGAVPQHHVSTQTPTLKPHKGDIYARAGITIIASSRNLENYGLPGAGRCLRRPQREEKIGKVRLIEGIVPALAITNAAGELLDKVDWPIGVGEGTGSSAEDPLWIKNAEMKTIVVE